MAFGVIWRINPKECNYARLKPEGDVFSSLTSMDFVAAGVGVGTWLYAVASGKDRNKGVLGVWEVTHKPVRQALGVNQLVSFNGKHKTKRVSFQWRVRARLVHKIHAGLGDNRDIFLATSLAGRKWCPAPSLLDAEQLMELNDAYGI